jgi:hypothetical protein
MDCIKSNNIISHYEAVNDSPNRNPLFLTTDEINGIDLIQNEIKNVYINWKKTNELNLMFDYKFILYKFPKPLDRNIQSIQIRLINELPKNQRIYISLYSDSVDLTNKKHIKNNNYNEILQYKYIPSQITPSNQFQLIAHIEKNILYNDNYIDDDEPELLLDIELKIKYCYFKEPEKIHKLSIQHNDDTRVLKLVNGNCIIMSNYI